MQRLHDFFISEQLLNDEKWRARKKLKPKSRDELLKKAEAVWEQNKSNADFITLWQDQLSQTREK